MWKTRLPLPWLSWTGPLLLCALLSSACQPDSAKTPEALADESADQAASLITDDIPWSLSGDALIAPEQPELRIRAEAATLILDWSPIAGQTVARLYQHDSALPGETLVYESDDAQQHLLHLPSATPQTPWHREQYRLELCTADNCVSSERMALSGLASATAHYLSPSVFVQGERYAEHLALNRDASLAVLSMPVSGSLEFHIRSDNTWSLSQRLRLDALPGLSTRSLFLAASDSGDTVVVLVKDTTSTDRGEIRILERLGEAWFQTAHLALTDEQVDVETPDAAREADTTTSDTLTPVITMAGDGNGLMVQSDDRLYTSRRSESGWSPVQLLADLASTGTRSVATPQSRLIHSTSSGDFTRILAVIQRDDSMSLTQWSAEPDASSWRETGAWPLSGFNQEHEIALHSNAQGDELLIAGWEAGSLAERSPIMWHYSIKPDPGLLAPAEGIVLQAINSLRAQPTGHSQASLVFNASDLLTDVVLGWQLVEDAVSGIMPDAALASWRYHPVSDQWLSALELPEAIPTLAKQAFARELVLSADGSTLAMTTTARTGLAPDSGYSPAIGEVLVLR